MYNAIDIRFTGSGWGDYLSNDEQKDIRTKHRAYVKHLENLGLACGLMNRCMWFTYAMRTYVMSYETVVASWDLDGCDFRRHWDGYSKTTLEHIRKVYDETVGYRLPILKSDWESIRAVDCPEAYMVLEA